MPEPWAITIAVAILVVGVVAVLLLVPKTRDGIKMRAAIGGAKAAMRSARAKNDPDKSRDGRDETGSP
jgi:hypothetical protein